MGASAPTFEPAWRRVETRRQPGLAALGSCYLPSFMRPVTLVVVGDPKAPQMRLLKQLPAQVEVIVSDDADELRTAVPKADILVNGGFHGTLFRQVFPY